MARKPKLIVHAPCPKCGSNLTKPVSKLLNSRSQMWGCYEAHCGHRWFEKTTKAP